MKVQLVLAPPMQRSRYEALGESLWPPMGVLYLAAYLREGFPDVALKVTDGARLGYDAALAEIEAFAPDVLGISFYTALAEGAARLAREAKRRLPAAFVVLGGPHATALPRETLEHSGADLVVVGEGEETLLRLVRAAAAGDEAAWRELPGVAYLEKGRATHAGPARLVENPPAPYVDPLDRLPMPAWDLVDMASYRGWFLTRQTPETITISARGCPYACTFCSNAVWKASRPAVRRHSPQRVADELERLRDDYGIREVFDNADEFNVSLPHALAVCAEIDRRRLGMTWKAQLRARPFSDDLAAAMAGSGCWYVHLGIESGNQRTLDGIDKGITLDDVEQTCASLKRQGITVWGLFMLYNVWEEGGQLRWEDTAASARTLDYAHSLVRRGLLDYISWSVTTPYPGSLLYDIAGRHRLIKPRLATHWEAWQRDELFVMELPGVARGERRRLKIKGETIRLRCMLRNHDFKAKDLPFLAKRGAHLLVRTVRGQ